MTTTQPAAEMMPSPSQQPLDADDMGGRSISQGRQAIDRFVHSWLSMTGLVVFALLIIVSYVAPLFYKWDYDKTDPALDPRHLSVGIGQKGHILGTDDTGFDLLARMFRGTQREFIIMLIATGVTIVLGVLVGALAGYYSKLVDNVLMRIVDIFLSVPALVILILVCQIAPSFAGKADRLALLFGIVGWMGLSRLIRAQFLSLREREYIEAARAMGASDSRIIFRHLIPNCLGTILVFGTLFAATSIIVEASITYLGYGVRVPDTSLGLLVSNGVNAVDTRPRLFYFPGVVIVLLVLSVNLVGEGIRKAFDPRNNRVRD